MDLELGVRSDAGARPHQQRPAAGCGVHRQDAHGHPVREGPRRRLELEPHHAGHRVRQPEHAGHAAVVHRDPGAQADGRQRNRVRLHAQPLGIHGGRRLRLPLALSLDAERQSAAVRTVRGLLGSSRAVGHRRAGGRMALRAALQHHRRQPRPGWPGIPPARRADSPPEPERPVLFQRRPLDDARAHNFKMGMSLEYNRKTEPGSADYMGNFDFGAQREQPAQHRQRLREHAARRVHDLHRADQPRRPRRAPLAERLLLPGQLAHDAAPDPRSRAPRAAQRLGLRSQRDEQRLLHRSVASATQAARVYRLVCTTGVPGNQACAAANQRAINPANPNVFFPTAFNGNIVPGSG